MSPDQHCVNIHPHRPNRYGKKCAINYIMLRDSVDEPTARHTYSVMGQKMVKREQQKLKSDFCQNAMRIFGNVARDI